MSTQRFTPEFKEEAVKQVVERGYIVPDAVTCLGVSAHSLYKWAKAVSPDRTEQQSKELLEARSETLRPRAQMRRVEATCVKPANVTLSQDFEPLGYRTWSSAVNGA